MIFQRSILREKITVAAVILFTLLTITLVLFLVRGLRSVAVGNLALDGVLDLMLITTLKYLPLLLVVAAMIAINMTVSRLYRDSEMSVWQASGQGNLSLLKPVAMMVVPMFVFVLFLNTVVTPWTSKRLSEYRNRSNVQELSLIKEGTFRTVNNGRRVLFINKVKVTNRVPSFENIFMAQKDEKGTTLIIAQQANIENTHDNRAFLVLKGGRQYDDKPMNHLFQSVKYDQYGFSLDEFTKIKSYDPNAIPVEQKKMVELWKEPSPSAQAEVYRRFSDAFMILPMAVLALVLGYVKPRGQRTWGLMAALLIFVIYLLMIKFSEGRVSDGHWGLSKAVALVHGGCLMITTLALWYRYHAWRFTGFSLFKRRAT